MKSFAVHIMVPDEVPGSMPRTFRVVQYTCPDKVNSAQVAAFVASSAFINSYLPIDTPENAVFSVVEIISGGMIRVNVKFSDLTDQVKHDAVIQARQGGGFLNALSEAYSRADKPNRKRLEEAFGDDFMRFATDTSRLYTWARKATST